MEQVKNSATNTDISGNGEKLMGSILVSPVEKNVVKSGDKGKEVAVASDKAVNTHRISQLHRSVNTEHQPTRNTGVNTDSSNVSYQSEETDAGSGLAENEEHEIYLTRREDLLPGKPSTSVSVPSETQPKSIKSIMKQPGSTGKKVKKELSFSEDVEEAERWQNLFT